MIEEQLESLGFSALKPGDGLVVHRKSRVFGHVDQRREFSIDRVTFGPKVEFTAELLRHFGETLRMVGDMTRRVVFAGEVVSREYQCSAGMFFLGESE